jgi:cyclophilin family peptidyl-prolyl cis-trans isomerase
MKYWKNYKKQLIWIPALIWIISVSLKPVDEKVKFVEITTNYGKIIIALYNETPLHRDNFLRMTQEKGFDSLLFHRVIPELIIEGGDPRSKHSGKGIPMELSSKLYHKRGVIGMARDRRDPYLSSPNQFYIVQGRTFSADELSDIENHNNINGKKEMLNRLMKSDSVMAKFDDFKLRGDKDGLHDYLTSLQDDLDKIYEPLMFTFSADQARQYLKVGGAPHLDGLYTIFGEVVYGMNVVDSIASAPRDAYDRPLKDIRMTVKLMNR